MSSQTLITGATGFIGRQLTRDLLRRGEKVRVLVRNEKKARELFGHEVEVVVGDLGDTKAIARATRSMEMIYHIGGIYRFGLSHRRELWRVNVEGTEHLMRNASEMGVAKVVHLSSGGILKRNGRKATKDNLLDEKDFPTEEPRFCSYKSSKWHAELRALAWAKRGLNVTVVNTTCPIGQGDEAPTPTGQIIRDFLDRRFPFYCRSGLNFISISDLSVGLQQAARAGRSGERYLICDKNLWLKEYLDLLAEETGLPAPTRCLPHWIIHMAGVGGEIFDLIKPRSQGARVCLETAVQAGHVQFFSNAKARGELGWEPTRPLRQSIHEAVAWFRNEQEMEAPPRAAASLESHVR